MEKINLHTHTTFCDGNFTAREMLLAAIQKKFTVIGFSGHSMYPFASDWHIPVQNIPAYVKEIQVLREEFKEQITVLCGFEADYIPAITVPSKENYKEFAPDYLIGSVHYVLTKNGLFSVDDKAENVAKGVADLYNNDGKQMARDYFETQRQMLKAGDFEIIGHPDLIRKRNGILKMFDESDSWYKEELKLTAKAIAASGVVTEINTGAIARGAMDDVYPSEYFLQLLYEAGVPICINSDAHTTEGLDCAFSRAAAIAKKIGYKELNYPAAGFSKNGSLKTIGIDALLN